MQITSDTIHYTIKGAGMKRKTNQPKVETMEIADSTFDETPVMEQPIATESPRTSANQPENGCYGEIKLYCGREHRTCHFREFIDASPSGLIHACLRCKDIRIKIDTGSKCS